MTKKRTYSILIISFLTITLIFHSKSQNFNSGSSKSQTIEQLQKSIDQTNLLLNGSREHKSQILKQLELIQSQITYRKELQQNLLSEIDYIENQIKILNFQHENNIKELQKREKEYILLLKNKLVHRLTYNPILALLNPEDIDKKIKRWYLIDRMENQTKSSYITLQETKKSYKLTRARLESESCSRDSLLKSTVLEEKNLAADIIKSNQIIRDLSSRESELNNELIGYKKKKDELKLFIEASVKNLTAAKESIQNLKSNLILNYPMQNPTIISRFGNNMEKGKSKLIIRNNGVDLQSANPFVKNALSAEVVEIRKMPNQLYLLITRSENLFIVYSNLENVLLKNGERIESGVNLGKAAKTAEGLYELHFETWIEKTPVDPLRFLKS